jgi:DNA-binding CsgD family transcriptional regulator
MARACADPVDQRVASWLDAVGELLSKPLARFPAAKVHEVFLATFEIDAVAFGWMGDDGQVGFMTTPRLEAMWRPEWLHEMSSVFPVHPLQRWFDQNTECQSLGRVPAAYCVPGARAKVRHLMRDTPCTEQLAIPLGPLGRAWCAPPAPGPPGASAGFGGRPGDFRMISLGRTGRDFSDDDVLLARRLQPVLRGLDLQCQIAGRPGSLDEAIQAMASSPLSPRQIAVMGLVADGMTAGTVGRRLGISARTVEKHLEQAYRKLGVQDRVSAVRLCADLGRASAGQLVP